MNRKSLLFISFITSFLLLPLSLSKLIATPLLNGPMLSDLTYREAQIWIQTESPSLVAIHYFETESADKIFITPSIKTDEANACVANFVLSKIEPNKSYTYAIEIDGSMSSKEYTFNSLNYYYEKEPAPNVKIAILGTHYGVEQGFEPPYRRLGDGYSIFEKVYEAQPNLVLWAGNTAHLRKSDVDSLSGYFKRYSFARSLIQPKELIAQIPNLGIWSYNDYGIANSGKEMPLKHSAQKAFSKFWPKTRSVEHQDAFCYTHKISDAEFFFLDVQSQRNTNTSVYEESTILGKEQIEWLKNALLVSTAKFKIIVSGAPVLNPSKTEKNLSFANNEKEELIDLLKIYKIPGLFFISGGSYKGELTRMVHSTHYNFFDLTVGPSTAMPISEDKELNFYRIPGTNTFEKQYTILEIKGDEDNRFLDIQVFSLAGLELWSRKIKASELTVFE
ncbi:MAG: alkaline phosphatase D family protein [Opitutae bacterium]|jgi:alkaline phosphatase D|nr:alkaline phosphatase D family protein [Opitutae bacterium]